MNMRARELVEIVGIFSIVASLIFVGLQLMLDRRVAIGAQFHERSVLGHEAFQSFFDNSDWVESQAQHWENGLKPVWWNSEIDKIQEENDLSMKDMVRSAQRTSMEIIRANNNYFQYKQGLISEDSWSQILTGITSAMDRPVYRALAFSMNSIEKGFVEILRALEDEIDATSRIRL